MFDRARLRELQAWLSLDRVNKILSHIKARYALPKNYVMSEVEEALGDETLYNELMSGMTPDEQTEFESYFERLFSEVDLAGTSYASQSLAAELRDQGESQHQPDSDFDPVQLATGTIVELEHTDDFEAAKEIAKDHLAEDVDYYGKFIFPEEAKERIDEAVLDDYEPSEVTSGVKDWKLKLIKTILKSAVLNNGVLDISFGRICGAYNLDELTSGYLLTSAKGDPLSLLGSSDNAFYTTEELVSAGILSPTSSVKQYKLLVPSSKRVCSMAESHAKELYTKGIVSEKELKAILEKENGMPPRMAEKLIRMWAGLPIDSCQIVKVRLNSSETAFEPGDASAEACAIADEMNDLWDGQDPDAFVIAYNEHKLEEEQKEAIFPEVATVMEVTNV